MSPEPNGLTNGTRKTPSELTLRLITAAVGLPILGLVLYFGFWTVGVAAIVVAALVGVETRDMAQKAAGGFRSRVVFFIIGGMVPATALFVAATGNSADVERVGAVFGILALLLLIEIVVAGRFHRIEFVRRNVVLSYGAFVAIAVGVLPLVASLSNGRELLVFTILVVFASDTGAYFVGKRLGSRKLAPSVSPGKTWEGFIGGVISAVLVAWLLGELLSLNYPTTRILVIGLSIAVVGLAGDLGESWIKRLSGVKDSGVVVPGHGGIMDRLDALAPNFMLIYFVDRWLV